MVVRNKLTIDRKQKMLNDQLKQNIIHKLIFLMLFIRLWFLK